MIQRCLRSLTGVYYLLFDSVACQSNGFRPFPLDTRSHIGIELTVFVKTTTFVVATCLA